MNLSDYVRKTLLDFVAIPSTPDADMGRILDAATAAIEDLGLNVEHHADVQAVSASSGTGGVLLNGHLDTVPLASGWTRDQGSWDGDVLYGRGTADMKAGCVAGLAAARTLLDAGLSVSLLFTTDEETTMHGAMKLAASSLVKRAAAVVVAEPTRLRVVASEKGPSAWARSAEGRNPISSRTPASRIWTAAIRPGRRGPTSRRSCEARSRYRASASTSNGSTRSRRLPSLRMRSMCGSCETWPARRSSASRTARRWRTSRSTIRVASCSAQGRRSEFTCPTNASPSPRLCGPPKFSPPSARR